MPPEPLGLRVPRDAWRGFSSEPVEASHVLARAHGLHRRLIAEMASAGVPIMAGSDTPNLQAAPGMSLHDELELLVASGMTSLQALRAATTTPADYLGTRDSLGTVAPGMLADFVLLDADPIERIGNTRRIHAVVSRGRFHDRQALDGMIAQGRVAAAPVAAYWRARGARGSAQ
jgi:imidazolonepropionase-like amidohydrolase